MNTLRFEEIDKRYERTITFFRFLYYDWGDDDEDEEEDTKAKKTTQQNQNQNAAPKNQGTKEWQIYKDVNQYETKDKFGKQALKRDFYNKHINQQFNEIVNNGLDEEGMKKFNRYCHLYNSLGIVGYEENYDVDGQMVFVRRLLYLLYFFAYPLNIPYTWCLVAIACLFSLMQPNPRQKSTVVMNIFEEESMNISLIIFMAPSGQYMRILINVCLMMWALQHVAILAFMRLQKDPNTVGLSILTPLVEYIYFNKVELNFIKNAMEICLGFISVPFVFISQTALIFPILFYQYLKIKNMSNAFQKSQWKVIWEFLNKYASPLVGILRLCGFGKEPVEQQPKGKNGNKKTDEQLLMDQINEQQKKAKGAGSKKTNAADDDDDNIETIDTDHMKKID